MMNRGINVYSTVYSIIGGLLHFSLIERDEDGDLTVSNWKLDSPYIRVGVFHYIRKNKNNSVREFWNSLHWCMEYNKYHLNKAYVTLTGRDDYRIKIVIL